LELLPLINAGAVGLLDNRRLLDQLINLERRTSFGTGRDSVGHPPGAHDDVAVAVAGALLLATAKKPQMVVGCQDGSVIRSDGTRYWPRKEKEPLRFVTINEKEAIRQKEAGEWC
jgi:hypothetical protein